MGNWHISIEGVGAHHNADYPKDANKMGEAFVALLKDAGHTISKATFTHGGFQDLGSPNARGHIAQTAAPSILLRSQT